MIAKYPQDDAALRVILGFFGRDVPEVDQVLNVGVVGGQASDDAVPDQVGAGVADMHHCEPFAGAQCGDDGSAQTREFRVLGSAGAEVVVRGDDGVAQQRNAISGVSLPVDGGEMADCDGGGDVTARGASHPVGENQQVRSGIPGVLVDAADEADVRTCRVAQSEGHPPPRSSTTVDPILTRWPG